MGAIALRAMPSSEPLTAEQLRRMHFERLIVSSDRGPEEWRKDAESVGMAISALRPVSREQVEKVWRGEWETVADEGFVDTMGRQVFHLHCPVCDFFWRETGHKKYFRFCPHCGAPMTDEAVEVRLKELEALHGKENP